MVRLPILASLILIVLATVAASGCIAIHQRPTEVVRDRADRHFEFGRYREAAEEYGIVVSRYPGDWRAQYRLARSLMELEEWSGARRALELAHSQKPADPDIADALAEVMYQQSDEQQLFAFLRQRAEAEESVTAYRRLAHYALELGDPDSARVALLTAITLDAGETVGPYLDAANFAERLGDMDEAVRRLRQAYGINPHDRRVRERLIAFGEVPGPTIALPPGR